MTKGRVTGAKPRAQKGTPRPGYEDVSIAARYTRVTVYDDGILKPERNAPCPCGTGAKYKKCCWELKR